MKDKVAEKEAVQKTEEQKRLPNGRFALKDGKKKEDDSVVKIKVVVPEPEYDKEDLLRLKKFLQKVSVQYPSAIDVNSREYISVAKVDEIKNEYRSRAMQLLSCMRTIVDDSTKLKDYLLGKIFFYKSLAILGLVCTVTSVLTQMALRNHWFGL